MSDHLYNPIEIIKNSKNIIAISNYKYSQHIENYISKFDCVIRFNAGSNPIVLESKSNIINNNRTDICVLSGWKNGNFGPLEGFYDKPILFSRPLDSPNLTWFHKRISIENSFINQIKKYTTNLDFIPYKTFLDIYTNFQYDHPTTGFVVVYFIKKYLCKKISTINFYLEDKGFLYNTFLNMAPSFTTHNINMEKNILNNLEINNIII